MADADLRTRHEWLWTRRDRCDLASSPRSQEALALRRGVWHPLPLEGGLSESIEFFFDVASPYSYLAAARLDALGKSGEVDVVWRPFLLGAVFKATGNRAPAMVPAKGRYLYRDLRRWADRDGIALRWPKQFPVNSLLAQRALLAADAQGGQAALRGLAMALFEAYWVR